MSTWDPLCVDGSGSGSSKWIVQRCTSAAEVRATDMNSAQPMPSMPITSPLNTEVTASATPEIVPTSPLALSRRSSGTSNVTQVDSATPRRLPATEPTSVEPTISQNQGRPMSSIESSSASR